MPVELKLANADALLSALADTAVGEVNGIDSEALAVDLAPGQSFGSEKLTGSVKGRLAIRAFNSSDDEDEDGVIGPEAVSTPAGRLPGQLALGPGAYLKYSASVGLKAAASGRTLKSLGFELEGTADLTLSDYHRHTRETGVRSAVAADLLDLRTSLRLADVLALAPGDAVAQQFAGRVSAAVELSWTDVFSGSAGALARLLGTDAAIAVRCSVGATVKATLSFADDFILVLSRVDAQRWRAGLRKANTRAHSIGLALSASVGLDAGQLAVVVDRVFEALLGAPRAALERALGAASLDRLTGAQRALIGRVVERLGLEPATALDAVRQRVNDLVDRLEQTLTNVAASKIEAAFTYEYRRVLQETTVLQCLLTRAALSRHHPAIVTGRFTALLAEVAPNNAAATLEHFLYQRSSRTERSWGLSLSLGKWVTLGGEDRKVLDVVKRRSADRREQWAYLGERSYKESGDKQPKWTATFSAEMPSFARDVPPRVSEFDFAVALVWHEEKKRLDEKTLRRWIDHGVLWGALDARDEEDVFERCRGLLKETVSGVLQLTAPHAAFELLLALAGSPTLDDLGPSLAEAMPWRHDDPDAATVAARRRTYGELWTLFLATETPRSGREWARTAEDALRRAGARGPATREALFARQGGIDTHSFGGLIDANRDTRRRCQAFLQGLERLQHNIVSGAPDNRVVRRVFEELEDLWTQSHHVRAVGAWILARAHEAGVAGQLTRSLMVKPHDEDGEAIIVTR